MATLTAKLTGTGANRQHIREMIRTKPLKLRDGLYEAGLLLQRMSQQIVPIDTGNLKRSADTRDVTTTPGKFKIIVVYSTAYAIYVHENLTARHAQGKTAKFLERPARDGLKDFVRVVVNRLNT